MMTNQKQIRAAFWEAHPHFPNRRRRAWDKTTPLYYPATIRTAFVDFIDYLEKSGQISPALANRATLER
jgi:hypothetical protein